MRTESFRLPDVGEGIAEAEIVEWSVNVGDVVAEDDILVSVETDKSQVELPSPAAGRITAIHGEVGDRIKVGGLLVDFEVSADASTAIESSPPSANTGAPTAPVATSYDPQAAASAPSAPVDLATRSGTLASPRARRLAVTLGVDLGSVRGTGAHGRVLVADLEDYDPTAQATPTNAETSSTARRREPAVVRPTHSRETIQVPLRGLRRRIAESMTESLTVPHILEFKEIDATSLLATHRSLKVQFAAEGTKFSILPLLMMATVRALRLHPTFNARYNATDQIVTQYGAVHLGMATATDDGLIVPVLHDADQMDLRTIGQAIEVAAVSARTRTAASGQLTGGTFTVTNFGSFGTWLGTPIIRPPEVGIAGFGRIAERVIAVSGQPEVRPVLPLVVAADHRINDGAHLGAFITDLVAAIAEPALLLS